MIDADELAVLAWQLSVETDPFRRASLRARIRALAPPEPPPDPPAMSSDGECVEEPVCALEAPVVPDPPRSTSDDDVGWRLVATFPILAPLTNPSEDPS
jgi:hypothetical protein